MSRYDALTERLNSEPSDALSLTFDELDNVVGGLPKVGTQVRSVVGQQRQFRSSGWLLAVGWMESKA